MQNVIQWDLNSFFFQKLTKIAQRLEALPPDPHSHRRLGALPPDPRLWYVWVHYLTQHVSQVRLLRFLTISFRPFLLPKSWQSAIRLRLQIFHSTISLPHKKLLFRKFLMTSLCVICGLGPPESKILATPMVYDVSIGLDSKSRPTAGSCNAANAVEESASDSNFYCLILLHNVNVKNWKWAAQVIKVVPQAHAQLLWKSCAASVSASPKK